MRIKRASVDCNEPEWQREAQALLSGDAEVDLLNFNFAMDGPTANVLLHMFSDQFELTLDRDPKVKQAHFRKLHR